MVPPDQRLLEMDVQSAEFRIGAAKGLWAQAEACALPASTAWPKAYFWMSAAPRANAPSRFYVALDLSGYRSAAPTGAFWDSARKAPLEINKWPKGKTGSRFAMVFRTTGFNGAGHAFYHPFDRVATIGHGAWPKQQPHLVWTDKRTIVDYLEEFQALLNCGDYLGL